MSNINTIIYEMLTESTGKHMLDSGGNNNRYWQRNQQKSLEDFENEPRMILLDEDTDYPYYVKSTFHHLIDSCTYFPQEQQKLIDWVNEDKYHYSDNPEGRSLSCTEDVEKYMQNTFYNDKHILYLQRGTEVTNTYNFDCSLDQTLQYITIGDTYECDIIALSIHNGADVRGGYTDYKIFKIEEDLFYSWYEEYDEDRRIVNE